MKVHITGGTGFLGRELHRQQPSASTERVDVRDRAATLALFRRLAPDVVIHTAASMTDPAVNSAGAANVARAAEAVAARLIHVSTDFVFDGRKGSPYVEDDPVSPLGDYGAAKVAAETFAARHPDSLIVRTSMIVGGGKHEEAANDPDRSFYTDEIRCPIHVTSLAAALLKLARLDTNGILHVAGTEAMSRWEFSCRAAGRTVTAAKAPEGRPLDVRLDSTRAAGLLA